MKYKAECCGVVVLGRIEWIALGVPRAEERCPACGKWTAFVPVEQETKPVFGRKVA